MYVEIVRFVRTDVYLKFEQCGQTHPWLPTTRHLFRIKPHCNDQTLVPYGDGKRSAGISHFFQVPVSGTKGYIQLLGIMMFICQIGYRKRCVNCGHEINLPDNFTSPFEHTLPTVSNTCIISTTARLIQSTQHQTSSHPPLFHLYPLPPSPNLISNHPKVHPPSLFIAFLLLQTLPPTNLPRYPISATASFSTLFQLPPPPPPPPLSPFAPNSSSLFLQSLLLPILPTFAYPSESDASHHQMPGFKHALDNDIKTAYS